MMTAHEDDMHYDAAVAHRYSQSSSPAPSMNTVRSPTGQFMNVGGNSTASLPGSGYQTPVTPGPPGGAANTLSAYAAYHTIPTTPTAEKSFNLQGYTSVSSDRHLPKQKRSCKGRIIVGLVAVLFVLIGAVVVAMVLVHSHKAKADSSSGSPNGSGPGGSSSTAVFGFDGSTVTTETGSTFVYNNSFGGYWAVDPNDPFMGGKANSWSPAMNETWQWGVDRIFGVNLGGWLVLEPFITPAIYQKYQNITVPAIDEWTLHSAMTADVAGGGASQLEQHYMTFVTEEDFAQIAAAGLNWVRLPIPFWAIEKYEPEPFIIRVCWKYFLKAIEWGRKYGIRINLDLHSVPGSQNGWNHSGKKGQVDFLNGVMGVANAQRTLDYMRIFTEFISQPQYLSVVGLFSVINEPYPAVIGLDALQNFYLEMYRTLRNVTGTGAGNGPVLAIHDYLLDGVTWLDYLPGADRLALDVHPYFAFGGVSRDPVSDFVPQPCKAWASDMNTTLQTFGLAIAGEWSCAINDCGFWVESVGVLSNYETTLGAGACDPWNDWQSWNDTTKSQLKQFAMTQMDTLQNWFFWTWKIDPEATSGQVQAPFWSYKLGLDNGWIPEDPRTASGTCESLGFPPNNTFDGNFKPWQTGAQTSVTLAPSATVGLQWPPPSLTDEPNAALLPTYTATGTIVTMPVPTFTASVNAGDGWFDPQDQTPMRVPISGCTYPDPWNATAAAIPPLCTGT